MERNTKVKVLILVLFGNVVSLSFLGSVQAEDLYLPDHIPSESIDWTEDQWLSFILEEHNVSVSDYDRLPEKEKEFFDINANLMVQYCEKQITWKELINSTNNLHQSGVIFSNSLITNNEFCLAKADILQNSDHNGLKIKFKAGIELMGTEDILGVTVYVRPGRRDDNECNVPEREGVIFLTDQGSSTPTEGIQMDIREGNSGWGDSWTGIKDIVTLEAKDPNDHPSLDDVEFLFRVSIRWWNWIDPFNVHYRVDHTYIWKYFENLAYYNIRIIDQDTTGPQISVTPHIKEIDNDPGTIDYSVSDSSGVNSVNVWWIPSSIEDNDRQNIINHGFLLSSQTQSTLENIPIPKRAGEWYYYVEAWDNDNDRSGDRHWNYKSGKNSPYVIIDDDQHPPNEPYNINNIYTEWPYQFQFQMGHNQEGDDYGYSVEYTLWERCWNDEEEKWDWKDIDSDTDSYNDGQITINYDYPTEPGTYFFSIECWDNDNELDHDNGDKDREDGTSFNSDVITVNGATITDPTPEGLNGWVYNLMDNVDYNGNGIISAAEDKVTLQLLSATDLYNSYRGKNIGDDNYDWTSNGKFDMIMGNVYYIIVRGGQGARKLIDQGGSLELEKGVWDFKEENSEFLYTIPLNNREIFGGEEKWYQAEDVEKNILSDFHYTQAGYYPSEDYLDAIYAVVPKWEASNLENANEYQIQNYGIDVKVGNTVFYIPVDLYRYKLTNAMSLLDDDGNRRTNKQNLISHQNNPRPGFFVEEDDDHISTQEIELEFSEGIYPRKTIGEATIDPYSILGTIKDLKVTHPDHPNAYAIYDFAFGLGSLIDPNSENAYRIEPMFHAPQDLDVFYLFNESTISTCFEDYFLFSRQVMPYSVLSSGKIDFHLNSLKYGEDDSENELHHEDYIKSFQEFLEDRAYTKGKPEIPDIYNWLSLNAAGLSMFYKSTGDMRFGVNYLGTGFGIGYNAVDEIDEETRRWKYYDEGNKQMLIYDSESLALEESQVLAGDFTKLSVQRDQFTGGTSIINAHLEIEINTAFEISTHQYITGVSSEPYIENFTTTVGFDVSFIMGSYETFSESIIDHKYIQCYEDFQDIASPEDWNLPEIIFTSNTELKLGESTNDAIKIKLRNNEEIEKIVNVEIDKLDASWYEVLDEFGEKNSQFLIEANSEREACLKITIPEHYSISPGEYEYRVSIINAKNPLVKKSFERTLEVIETDILISEYDERASNVVIDAGATCNLFLNVKNLGNRQGAQFSA